MPLKADFIEDWVAHLKDQLVAMNCPVSPNGKADEIAIAYFNESRRKVSMHQRKFISSVEFSCPQQFQDGLNLFRGKVEAGQDLNPHMSRKINDPTFQDKLLNDWGVFHFHLGTEFLANGLIKGTEQVLFALVRSDALYAIGVFPHEWSNLDVVERVHSNWPQLVDTYRLRGFQLADPPPASSDVKVLRAGGVNTIIQMKDGTVYFPIGGGYASNGTSMAVRIEADSHFRMIRNLQQQALKNAPAWLAAHGISLPPDGDEEMKLVIRADSLAIYFKKANIFMILKAKDNHLDKTAE